MSERGAAPRTPNTYHVACRVCGEQWEAEQQPRECRNARCGAGWLDLPMFVDKAHADRTAAERTPASWPAS